MSQNENVSNISGEQLRTTRFLISIQDVVRYINNGVKLMNYEGEIDEAELINYYNSIILNPKYQRNYRSSASDASSVIISLLKGIPLPEIFLVNDNYNGTPMRNVMDGQHRLTAIYEFINNKYKLKTNIEEYNNLLFSELEIDDKLKILNYNLAILEFREIPTTEIEIELFQIYNSKQKQLTEQELHSSRYVSKLMDWLNNYVTNLSKTNNPLELDIKNAFNMTKDRVSKQKINQDLFAILWVLENGTNDVFTASTFAAVKMMEKYNKLFLSKQHEDIKAVEELMEKYIEFLKFFIDSGIAYPISTQFLEDENYRNYKFTISSALVYAYLIHNYTIVYDKQLIDEVKHLIKNIKIDERINSSSCANSRTLEKLVTDYVENQCLVSIVKKTNI